MHTTDIIVRIFTHADVPNAARAVTQIADAATERGLSVVVIDGGADSRQLIDAGVVAVPAVLIERAGVETARRECVRAGRGLGRWLNRRLGTVAAATDVHLSVA